LGLPSGQGQSHHGHRPQAGDPGVSHPQGGLGVPGSRRRRLRCPAPCPRPSPPAPACRPSRLLAPQPRNRRAARGCSFLGGWSSLVLVGLSLYVVSRTSRVPLWSPHLARIALWLWNLALLGGLVTLLAGVN